MVKKPKTPSRSRDQTSRARKKETVEMTESNAGPDDRNISKIPDIKGPKKTAVTLVSRPDQEKRPVGEACPDKRERERGRDEGPGEKKKSYRTGKAR